MITPASAAIADLQNKLALAQARIIQLEDQIAKRDWDTAYGCLTRAGLEAWWEEHMWHGTYQMVFLDIDEMGGDHGWNKQHPEGMTGTDRVIRAANEQLALRDGEVKGGRGFSGDELIYFLPDGADVEGFLLRLERAFAVAGLTSPVSRPMTFMAAVVLAHADTFEELLDESNVLVMQAKHARNVARGHDGRGNKVS